MVKFKILYIHQLLLTAAWIKHNGSVRPEAIFLIKSFISKSMRQVLYQDKNIPRNYIHTFHWSHTRWLHHPTFCTSARLLPLIWTPFQQSVLSVENLHHVTKTNTSYPVCWLSQPIEKTHGIPRNSLERLAYNLHTASQKSWGQPKKNVTRFLVFPIFAIFTFLLLKYCFKIFYWVYWVRSMCLWA